MDMIWMDWIASDTLWRVMDTQVAFDEVERYSYP